MAQASAAVLAGSAFSFSAVTSAAAACSCCTLSTKGSASSHASTTHRHQPPFHALSAVLPIDVAKTRIQTAFPGSVNNVGILQNMRLMWQTGDTALMILSNCEVLAVCSEQRAAGPMKEVLLCSTGRGGRFCLAGAGLCVLQSQARLSILLCKPVPSKHVT